MAKRAEKSALLLCATRLANLDLIDENADGGKAYKAFQIQIEMLCLQGIINRMQGSKPETLAALPGGSVDVVVKK